MAADAPKQQQPSFKRGSDLLQLGDEVTARQIVNVLGRWSTHEQWDTIGTAEKLDDFTNGDFYEEDLDILKTDFSKGEAYYFARRPQRRVFCKKYGLVQRWVHNENVGLLPFDPEAAELAASVGATVEELNAEPVDELAAQIVFDALCSSKASFVDAAVCDERRQSFVDAATGAFDAEAFGSAVARSRLNIVGALLVYPGFFVFLFLLLAWQLDWYQLALESAEHARAQAAANYEAHGLGPTLCALPVVGLVAKGALDRRAGKMGGLAEFEVRERDRHFVQAMRIQRTGADYDEAVALVRQREKEKRPQGRARGFLDSSSRTPRRPRTKSSSAAAE